MKETNVGSFATAKLQTISRRLIVITLAAVIGFSFVTCDNGGGGDGGGVSGPTFLGDNPTLSGQVYVAKYNATKVSYEAYKGDNLTVSARYDGNVKGTIKNGQFSITLETPTNIGNLEFNFGETIEATVSPSNIKGGGLDLYIGDSFYSSIGSLYRKNITGISSNATSEEVQYVYVDKDCTISSNGGTDISTSDPDKDVDDYTYTYILKPFSLELKAGWNTLYIKAQGAYSGKKRNSTVTYSLSNPGNVKWVLYIWDDDDH